MKETVHKHNASTVNGKASSIVISVVLLQVIFTAISRPRWHRRPARTVHSVWLPQFPHVRTNNLEQISTGSAKHRHWGTV